MPMKGKSLFLMMAAAVVLSVHAQTDYSGDTCFSNSGMFRSSTTVIPSQPPSGASTVLYATVAPTQGIRVDCMHVWRNAYGSASSSPTAYTTNCLSLPPVLYVCSSTQDIFINSGGVLSTSRIVTFDTSVTQVDGTCTEATYDYDASAGNTKVSHTYKDAGYTVGSTGGTMRYWWVEYRAVPLSQCFPMEVHFTALVETDLTGTASSAVTTIIIVCVVVVFILVVVVVLYVCFKTDAYRRFLGLKPSAKSGPAPPPVFSTASLSPPRVMNRDGSQGGHSSGRRQFSVSQSPYDYAGQKDEYSPVHGHHMSLMDDSDYSPPSSIDSAMYAGQGAGDRVGPLVQIQGDGSPVRLRYNMASEEPHTITNLGSPTPNSWGNSSPRVKAAPYALPTPQSVLRGGPGARRGSTGKRVVFAPSPSRMSPPSPAGRPLPDTPNSVDTSSRMASSSQALTPNRSSQHHANNSNGNFALFTPSTAGKQVGRGQDLGLSSYGDAATPLQPAPPNEWLSYLHADEDTSGSPSGGHHRANAMAGYAAGVPWGAHQHQQHYDSPLVGGRDGDVTGQKTEDDILDDRRIGEVARTIGSRPPTIKYNTNPQFEEELEDDSPSRYYSHRPRYMDPADDALL